MTSVGTALDAPRAEAEALRTEFAFELPREGKKGENAMQAPPYLLMREGNDYFGKGR